MFSPKRIVAWLETNVKEMHPSRRKTLSALVGAAMLMQGLGVLALGRTLAGPVAAKHCIKRVWRFLANDAVEIEAVSAAVLAELPT